MSNPSGEWTDDVLSHAAQRYEFDRKRGIPLERAMRHVLADIGAVRRAPEEPSEGLLNAMWVAWARSSNPKDAWVAVYKAANLTLNPPAKSVARVLKNATPLHIDLLLHYYAVAEPFHRPSPAATEYTNDLERLGLIERERGAITSGWRTTQLGKAEVAIICGKTKLDLQPSPQLTTY